MNASPTSPLVDRLGVMASTACAVHCALVALLPAILATAGLSALLGEEAEWGFVLAAATLGGVAMVTTWRRHKRVGPVPAFAVGIAGLLAARFMEEAGIEGPGTAVAVVSGGLLVLGHLLSLRRGRRVAACEDECHAPR